MAHSPVIAFPLFDSPEGSTASHAAECQNDTLANDCTRSECKLTERVCRIRLEHVGGGADESLNSL